MWMETGNLDFKLHSSTPTRCTEWLLSPKFVLQFLVLVSETTAIVQQNECAWLTVEHLREKPANVSFQLLAMKIIMKIRWWPEAEIYPAYYCVCVFLSINLTRFFSIVPYNQLFIYYYSSILLKYLINKLNLKVMGFFLFNHIYQSWKSARQNHCESLQRGKLTNSASQQFSNQNKKLKNRKNNF